MNIFTAISLLATIGLIFLKFNDCLFWYLVFSFVMPVIRVAGISLSFEIVAFFPLILSALLSERGRLLIGALPQLWIYIMVGVLSSLLSVTVLGAKLGIVSLIGALRFAMLSDLIIAYMTTDRLVNAVKIIVTVNVIVTIIQLVHPSSASLTALLYAKESANAISIEAEGSLNRLTGTFNNVLPSALFNIVAMNVLIEEALFSNSRDASLYIIGAFFCGIMGASKTFVAGLALSLAVWAFLIVKWKSVQPFFSFRNLIRILAVILILMLVCLFAMNSRIFIYLQYYVETIISGEAFSSRFGEGGAVSTSLDIWIEYFFSGVGFATLNNEFVGDSQFLTALHTGGIIGLGCIVNLLIMLLHRSWKAKNFAAVVCSVMLLFVSTSGTTVFSLSGVFIIGYLARVCFDHYPPPPRYNASLSDSVRTGARLIESA